MALQEVSVVMSPDPVMPGQTAQITVTITDTQNQTGTFVGNFVGQAGNTLTINAPVASIEEPINRDVPVESVDVGTLVFTGNPSYGVFTYDYTAP